MVMNSRPAPPPGAKVEKNVCLVNYGLMKRTGRDDPPFFALVQQHVETTASGKHFWLGVAIDTAANRQRRFETMAGALQELNLFRAIGGVRVDAIVRVSSSGQKMEHWVAEAEQPPQGPDSGTW